MNTWLKIGCVIAARVIVDVCLGALWGLWLGVLCGALCGAIFAVLATLDIGAIFYGLWFGAIIGAFVGFVSGFSAFLLHSLRHLSANLGFVKRWRSVADMMLRLSFIGAFSGGLSAAFIGLIYWMAGGAARDSIDVIIMGKCSAYSAGFFYGSVAGFFGSLILAALFPEQLERLFSHWRAKKHIKRTGKQPKIAA